MRIGANWGSLDQELLTTLMDENTKSANPQDARAITREAMVQSALLSAKRAEEIGLSKDKIILSAKVSAVQDLIAVYQELARRSDYAIHLGLTEAGMGSKGIVASSAALGILMQQGIGDTIRISLTPEPGGDRTVEVKVAQEILQTMGFRVFVPLVAACPGCGRTTSTTFQELARDIQGFIHESMPTWKTQYPGVEALNVAVMGCIVNGPGESKHADIGISLPGTGETPAAPVFIDGKKAVTLRGPTVAADFKKMVIDYIEKRYGAAGAGRGRRRSRWRQDCARQSANSVLGATAWRQLRAERAHCQRRSGLRSATSRELGLALVSPLRLQPDTHPVELSAVRNCRCARSRSDAVDRMRPCRTAAGSGRQIRGTPQPQTAVASSDGAASGRSATRMSRVQANPIPRTPVAATVQASATLPTQCVTAALRRRSTTDGGVMASGAEIVRRRSRSPHGVEQQRRHRSDSLLHFRPVLLIEEIGPLGEGRLGQIDAWHECG